MRSLQDYLFLLINPTSLIQFSYCWLFEKGPHVAQGNLELTMYERMVLNFESVCLHLKTAQRVCVLLPPAQQSISENKPNHSFQIPSNLSK